MSEAKNPLVSVIIPVYNVEEYLAECVESVLGQTHKNIEVILVDDGSTDKSGKICDKFAKKDERIKVIHKKNGGLNMARKSGFEVCTGDWITFVDSDDIISENLAEYLLEAVTRYGSELAICSYNKFTDTPNICHTEAKITVPRGGHIVKTFLAGVPEARFYLETVPMKLFKRCVLDKVDWQECNFRINEDEATMSYVYSSLDQSDNIPLVDNQLYFYRQRSGSIMDGIKLDYSNALNGKSIDRWDFIYRIRNLRLKLFGESYRDEINSRFSALYLVYLLNQASSGGYRLSDKNRKLYDDNLQDIIKAHDKYPLWSLYTDMFEYVKDKGSIGGALDYLWDTPTVSIVIPVWNGERHLRECLDSVIKQTYKNTEIILVDDGSTDSSGDICDEYAGIDERIVVVHRENGGVSSARNLGIDMASGEYVMFVDGDDFLATSSIEELMKLSKGVDVVIGDFYHYHSDVCVIKSGVKPIPVGESFVLDKVRTESIISILTAMNTVWGKLISRELINKKDIRFTENLKIAEDFEFIAKAFVVSRKIAYMDEALYYYRDEFTNETSATGRVSESKALDFGKALKSVYEFVISGNFGNNIEEAMPKIAESHSAYALTITEKDPSVHRKVFDYIRKDIFPYFHINRASASSDEIRNVVDGKYEKYLLNRVRSTRSYLDNRLEAVGYLEGQVQYKDSRIKELEEEISYLKSVRGMVRTPLGKVKRLVQRTIKKIIK